MAKANNFETMAAEMAARLDRQRAQGEQLSLLPEEAQEAAGRPVRGQGKALNQMRDWLASRGMRLPEQVLAEMAGLTSRDDAVVTALAAAEKVLLWAFDGAEVPKGGVKAPTAHMRIAMFQFVYTSQLRALDALLPYGLAKVTPDAAPVNVTQIVMPAAPSGVQDARQMRDVTPADRAGQGAAGRRIGPPPMPHEIQQDQGVKQPASDATDGEGRTE